MAGVPVRAGPDRFLNTSKGVVTHKDLLRCKEDEFVRRCEGVTYAKHIKKWRGEEMIPTNTFILTFNSPTLPTQVKTGRQEALGETPYPEKLLRDHFVSNLSDKTCCQFLRSSLFQSLEQTFRQIREQAIRWANDESLQVDHIASADAERPESRLEATLASLVQKMEQCQTAKKKNKTGFWEQAVGETPKVTVKIAVVNSGSQVTTVTEELVR
ncbi:Gag-like protein [Elysia marginata]|uniref:Gag-like protein n=1 Tax=Elysia marginata TaxID=1093978 RepID=A0AAV4HQA8_9GAST|nr:Gag-like protein [Elysia marginata]